MLFIRSFFFNVLFYSWTLLCGVVFTPVLFLPRIYTLKVVYFWVERVIWLCEHILHLQFTLVGNEGLLKTSSLFAIKHQSVWETFIFYYLLSDPVIALKKELLWIPFFGWYLKKLNMIPLSRSTKRRGQDLVRLLKNAEEAVSCSRPLLIFPEGT
ncbi:MAG: 1-acyl-sn-glycerol-3-phosphate acyltransferase, partial [Alphaproteobacteria bacterium]|nr:1-acyl-sn-glycerol-3-phosphate acyltransferase [Alphaproteobacteria bacterium]